MADNIDMIAFHDAIVHQLKERYPDFHIQFYRGSERGEKEQMPVPCILLDCEEFEVDEDADSGTEQLPTVWNFEALIIIKELNVPRARFTIRAIASSLATFLKLRRWNIPNDPEGKKFRTGPARVTGAYRDAFYTQLDQFAAWRVEWRQAIDLGDNIWFEPGDLVPDHVWLGQAPDIGFGHEDDYRLVIPAEGGAE